MCFYCLSLSVFFHLVDVTFKFYSNRRRRSLQRWWNLFCMYSSRWRNALRTTVFHTLISLWPIYYVIIEYTVFTAVVAATNRYFAICSVAIITPHLSNKQQYKELVFTNIFSAHHKKHTLKKLYVKCESDCNFFEVNFFYCYSGLCIFWYAFYYKYAEKDVFFFDSNHFCADLLWKLFFNDRFLKKTSANNIDWCESDNICVPFISVDDS